MPASRGEFDREATYVRSHIVSPLVLACLRACFAVYLWSSLIVGYSWLAHNGTWMSVHDIGIPSLPLILNRSFIGKSFSYFTFLTYWSLALYFAVSAGHTFVYAWNLHRGRKGRSISFLHDVFPRPLQLAHALWHTTITTFPFLVTLVFWGTMFSPTHKLTSFGLFINISVHGLNSFFAIFEIVCTATAPPPFVSHLLITTLLLALYLGLAYLTKLTQDFYPYPWMTRMFGWQGIVAHVFAYGAGMAAIYALVWGAKWLRERIANGRKDSRAQMWEVESWSTTPCSQLESGLDHSKAPSLAEKEPQITVLAVP